jgi:hypothetical protein
MFGIGDTPELTKDGAIISRDKTWFIAVLFLVSLYVVSLIGITITDGIWMSRNGVLVNGTIVGNRTEGTGDRMRFFAMIAYTPEQSGASPPTEIRAELPTEGAYIEGTVISIYYDPGNVKRIQLYNYPEDWYALAFVFVFAMVPFIWLSNNLRRRLNRDIVYIPPPPDPEDYTPTAEEDAEYDRNFAAGRLPEYGEVNGKWAKLPGPGLDTKQLGTDNFKWIFLFAGAFTLLTGLAFLTVGLWFVSIILIPAGAIFCYGAYFLFSGN